MHIQNNYNHRINIKFNIFFKLSKLELIQICNLHNILIKYKCKLTKLELIYKRVNDNLIDIEENDQDDKDALKNNRGATASELPLLDINSETNQNNSNNSNTNAPESKKNETSNNFIKLSAKKSEKDPIRKNTLSVLKEDSIPNLSEEEGKLTVTAKKEDANKYKEDI